MTTTTYPTAQVLEVINRRGGYRTVRVACPYGCKRGHTHGWPPDSPDVGPRVAHCIGETYIVTGAPDAPQRGPRSGG